MANLILPRRFNQQPQGAVEKDAASPLTGGLTNIYLPSNREKPIALSGNASISPSSGRMAYRTGANGIVNINDASSWTSPDTQRLTMAFVGRINSIDSPYGGLFVKRKASNTANGPLVQRDNANDKFRINNGSAYAIWPSITISSLMGRDIVMVITMLATGGVTTAKVYVNGQLADAANIGAWISTDSSGDFLIGAEHTANTAYGSDVDCSLFSVWNGKVLNDTAIAEFSRNPWQIFRAKPRTFYFDAAIGGGSDTSLVVSDTPHIHTAEAVAVASSSLLTVAGDASSHAAEVVGVTSVSAIVVGAASHGHTAENSVLQTTGAAGLVVADGVHNHTSVAPLITAASQMTVNEATHNSVNDFVSFTTADYLAIANSNSASDADATVLSLPGMEALLVIANAANSHTADSVVVGSAHVLNVFNALNAHIAVSIEVGVTSNTLLEILGAIHTHTADASLGLTCATTLAILENILEHNSTSPVITSWDGFITTKRAYTVVAENRSYIVMLEDRSHTVMTENRMYAVPVD